MTDVMAAISSSAWKVRTPNSLKLDSSWRMSDAGVIGYEPRNSVKPDFDAAATKPRARALLPLMLR
jgi:hypothetical protein